MASGISFAFVTFLATYVNSHGHSHDTGAAYYKYSREANEVSVFLFPFLFLHYF